MEQQEEDVTEQEQEEEHPTEKEVVKGIEKSKKTLKSSGEDGTSK